GREAQTEKSERIHEQAEGQQFFAADAVSQHSCGIAREKIGDHHHRDEQGGFAEACEVEVLLDQKIKRHQRDMIDVREGVKGAAKPERPHPLFVVRGHSEAGINEQPRGSAASMRAINSKPVPRSIPRSSVWMAITDQTFAKSKTRIKPVWPLGRGWFVS